MYTIGRLAKMFNLSRSTLLYYDRIGLLKPSVRTPSNYRQYSERDKKRLQQICMYRECGLALKDIARLLHDRTNASAGILESHLTVLSRRIAALRSQQSVILKLLKDDMIEQFAGVMNIDRWASMLRSVGLDDEAMHQWHMEFERLSPNGHQDFLKSFGLSDAQIEGIRQWSGKKG